MLKINPTPTFKATVHLTVPGSDATEPVEFTFKHRSRDAMDVWVTALQSGARRSAAEDAKFIADVVVKWSAVMDDQGNEVPYSVDALTKLFDAYPPSANEVSFAYIKAMQASRAKN